MAHRNKLLSINQSNTKLRMNYEFVVKIYYKVIPMKEFKCIFCGVKKEVKKINTKKLCLLYSILYTSTEGVHPTYTIPALTLLPALLDIVISNHF